MRSGLTDSGGPSRKRYREYAVDSGVCVIKEHEIGLGHATWRDQLASDVSQVEEASMSARIPVRVPLRTAHADGVHLSVFCELDGISDQ